METQYTTDASANGHKLRVRYVAEWRSGVDVVRVYLVRGRRLRDITPMVIGTRERPATLQLFDLVADAAFDDHQDRLRCHADEDGFYDDDHRNDF